MAHLLLDYAVVRTVSESRAKELSRLSHCSDQIMRIDWPICNSPSALCRSHRVGALWCRVVVGYEN
jgi:hypothetical protein